MRRGATRTTETVGGEASTERFWKDCFESGPARRGVYQVWMTSFVQPSSCILLSLPVLESLPHKNLANLPARNQTASDASLPKLLIRSQTKQHIVTRRLRCESSRRHGEHTD